MNFYNRDTLIVAKELLGNHLVHKTSDGFTVGKIVETEAYIGPYDAGSHAYNGKRTKRTEVQFGPPGYAYIYQIYGIHYCFNVVTQKENMPEVVLIRALEPINGLDIMLKRRGFVEKSKKNIKNLSNGPGKLCCAMGIDKSRYGHNLCNDELYIAKSLNNNEIQICSTPRINIDYAGEAKNYPWRFIIKDNEYVSIPG